MEDRPSSERVNFSICRASGDPASRIDGADIAGATARECAEISEGTTFPEKSVGKKAAWDGTAIGVRAIGIGNRRIRFSRKHQSRVSNSSQSSNRQHQ